MAREGARGKRPFKVWDSWRKVKKALAVSCFQELYIRGKEKLSLPPSESVRLVLDDDGTQVEDAEYFEALPNNTVLLILRQGEKWHPREVDVIRSAISSIPRIVNETIRNLELYDAAPVWRIMEDRGHISLLVQCGSKKASQQSKASLLNKPQSLIIQASLDKFAPKSSGSAKKESLMSDVYMPPRYMSGPQLSVINHDEMHKSSYNIHRLQKGSSTESTIHVHTPECANHAHHSAARSGSPGLDAIDCDFHCCALHEEGRPIVVNKNVLSPIQDPQLQPSPQSSSLAEGRRPGLAKPHVRFLDIEVEPRETSQSDRDSSESENEILFREDDRTCEKFLLLIDHPSLEHKHLTIKDIGVILERLSSTILDVERLDRECESEEIFNWTIRATVKRDESTDIGVVYNNHFYAISEHPGYFQESPVNEENGEEENRL